MAKVYLKCYNIKINRIYMVKNEKNGKIGDIGALKPMELNSFYEVKSFHYCLNYTMFSSQQIYDFSSVLIVKLNVLQIHTVYGL